jgi:ribosomal-protein-alanine N-acetyltransferase
MAWIRKVKIEDIPAVYKLEVQSFGDPYSPLLLMNLLALYPYGFFVAERDGKIIGYVISRIVAEKGHVIALAVEERFRKRNVGSELLKKAVDVFRQRGVGGAWLEVRVSNLVAQRFYADRGFKKVGTADSYYADGEDAIIFYRTLSS